MRTAIVLSALLMVSVFCLGQTCQQLVPQVLTASDANAALEGMGSAFRMDVEQYEMSRGMSVEDRKKVKAAIDDSFQLERMAVAFRDKMMKGCDAKAYTAALQHLNTPLYQHFDEMYKESNKPENLVRKQRFVRAMAMQSPRESRVRLMDAMMDASGSSDLFTSSVTELVSEIVGGEYRTAPTKQQAEMMKTEVFSGSRQTLETVALFTYKGATDQELSELTAMYGKPEMKRYVAIRNRAMQEVVRVEAHELALKLRKIASESNSPIKD